MYDQNDRPLTTQDWYTTIKVPSIGKSFERGLIGTAFDYAARSIVLKFLARENVVKEKYLTAEIGLSKYNECAELMQLFPTGTDDIDKERYEGLSKVWQSGKEIHDYLKDQLKSAKEARENFIDGNIGFKTMVEGAVFLARLDEIYRAQSIHVVDEYFREKEGKTYFSQFRTLNNEDLVNQVCRLSLIFDLFLRTTRWEKAILNPEFGEYSETVGGADADLIINDILIDIKTRNKLNYSGDDFAQLFVYAAMAQKVGMNVEKVGIYYARFGVFASIKLDDPLLQPDFLDNYLKKIVQIAEE